MYTIYGSAELIIISGARTHARRAAGRQAGCGRGRGRSGEWRSNRLPSFPPSWARLTAERERVRRSVRRSITPTCELRNSALSPSLTFVPFPHDGRTNDTATERTSGRAV